MIKFIFVYLKIYTARLDTHHIFYGAHFPSFESFYFMFASINKQSFVIKLKLMAKTEFVLAYFSLKVKYLSNQKLEIKKIGSM